MKTRLICEHTITKGDAPQKCNRYLGDLMGGSLALKCPRCGGVTHITIPPIPMVNFQDWLDGNIGGDIHCKAPIEGET